MQENNKRIVKNTLLLYVRSLVMMAIGIYTSRVILQALGVDDYGLYGVVGTVVAAFTVINGVLATGTSRFLTFELGRGQKESLQKVFSASFAMHLGMAVFITILSETVGLWFLNTHINIPEGREVAANWVYQFSVLTCFFGLTQVPYNATIIAHEKMELFAYIGIAEAIFKLAVPLTLVYGRFSDNLIVFAALLAAWSIGLQVFYRVYCITHFPETRLIVVRDKSVYKSMLSYSLWDFLGQMCGTTNLQGVSILINMFFGVTLNAAQTVANTVEMKIEQFVRNFMTAVNPQIVKSYAQADYKRFFQLIYESGKYSYYLFLFLSMPVFLECDYILSLWLVEVPPFTTIFLRFTIAIVLFRTPARPLIHGVHATGDVKFMNLTSGLTSVVFTIPGTYCLFKLGYPFWSFLVLKAVISLNGTVFEIISLHRKIRYNILNYLKDVYGKILVVTTLSAFFPVLIIYNMDASFLRLCFTCFGCIISTGFSILFLGIDKATRLKLIQTAKSKIYYVWKN